MAINHLAPLSGGSGLEWPAFTSGKRATVLGLLFQLQQSELWSPEQLINAQYRQLAGLLAHAIRTVPYYKDLLLQLDWSPEKPLTNDNWQKIPVSSRKQIQTAGRALWSQAIDPAHGSTSEVHTSGSSGTPIRITKTTVCDLMYVAVNLRDHLWHRRDLLRKLAMIRTLPDGVATYPKGARQAGWGAAVEGLFPSGECVGLAITATVAQQLEWLQRERPAYLLAFPSVVEALAQHALRHNIRLQGLAEITTLGETLNADLRQLCRDAFGVDLVDTYSSQEVGYMALQCPDTLNYHVQSEAVYLEVLDANNQLCKPGEVGRVVVTPLHNFAMPLIRYEVGDYAEVGHPCTCGRGLPTLKRILGRSRNMLTLPNGDKLWPRLSELRYGEIIPFSQFQMVQKSLELLEVKLVALREVTKDEEARLRQLIVSRIGHPFRVEFSYHSHLPRSASGKYEDFRSDL